MIKNNLFKKISWYETLNIINKKLITKDASNIKSIVGDLVDLESLYLLKKNFNKLGISNIVNENYFFDEKLKINSDLTSNFLFNNTLKSIEEADVCLIINSDIRKEGSILNIHLINRLKKGNFKIAYIGNKTNFTYPIQHLGTTLKTLLKIILGKHFFCKDLKKAKKPLIIVGENILNQKNGYYLIEKLKNLSFLKKKNINFFNTKTSLINFFEINFFNTNLKKKSPNIYYLYNTNLKKRLKKKENDFIIYQGHHFTEDAQQSDLILPGLTFLDKKGTYINVEGFIQKNDKILNLNTEQKNDKSIYKYIYKYILNKNQFKIKKESFLTIKKLLPYLMKKKINIINNFIKNKKKLTINPIFLNSFVKNDYYNNILEQYSKILIHSKKLLVQKNIINFQK